MGRDLKPVYLRKWHIYWNKTYRDIKCYATGDREDGLFEAVYQKKRAAISLGIFEDAKEAIETANEFRIFLHREKGVMYNKRHRLKLGIKSPKVKRMMSCAIVVDKCNM